MVLDCRLDCVDPNRPSRNRAEALAEAQERAGLCASCRHARVTHNHRGHDFWRCGRSDVDPRFARYPRMPVRRCAGHAEAASEG